MIEIDKNESLLITTYFPYEDSKEELLQALYALIPLVHKEPHCINYELFIDHTATITTVARFISESSMRTHTYMQYMEEFYAKKVPVFCTHYEQREMKHVIPPITALSLSQQR